MSGTVILQGEGLDPQEFLPIQMPAPEPVDNSEEDDRQKASSVPKRKADKILKEAKERFKHCQDWESHTRKLQLEDLKFAEADADNGWQWPDAIRTAREIEKKPYLTINKTRQHCLMITNDAKQNKPSVKMRAAGGGATLKAAQVLEGIVRHIEYQSNAASAYDTATEFQVKMGIGYWRVVTDYVSEDSFDQEIFIRRIRDPFSVYLDPDILEADGSDARYAFIFDDILKTEFERLHPKWKDVASGDTVLQDGDGWYSDEYVRVAEYFRRVEREEELLSIVNDQTGQRTVVRSSQLSPEIVAQVKQDPRTRTRMATMFEVEWYLIAGSSVIETKIWPGQYIPVVRVVGEETIIERQLDRKGHVRAMKDPQRMYNYWSSSAVENVALQSKTPYVGAVEAIEGYENYYETANKINHAYLPYNGYDDQGRKLDPPQRQQPVQMPQAYLEGLQIANQELMAVSGQYETMLGDRGDEKTGIAIQERQRTGSKSTYHYIDNLATAIRFTGKILLDLIPKIYDTPRAIRILGEDGTESQVQIDPAQQQALAEGPQPNQQEAENQAAVMQIFNPSVGRYEVYADVGPNYATRRQEAFNAFTQIIAQRPELVQLIGDILMKAGDFPMAEEAAERLKRMVPPQALGEGPSPEVQALMQQVDALQGSLAASLQALADKASETKVDQEKVAVDVFKAETDRLKAVADMLAKAAEQAVSADQMVTQVVQGLMDTLRTESGIIPEIAQGLQTMDPTDQGIDQPGSMAQPLGDPGASVPRDIQPSEDPTPIEGIRRAPDGKFYLPDPSRPGKYLEVLGTT